MAIMTKEQFQDSIRARKPMNVWFLGEKIEDLTTFPVLSASFNAISKVYELHNHPDWEDLLTIKSDINGEKVSIYNAPLRSPEDANRKTRAARALAEVIGCCTHRCTGSEAFAGLGPCTYDMDHDLGTDYFKRFTNFIDYVQKNDLSCTVTVTDVKGLRTLPPHKQPNRDNYIHVDEFQDVDELQYDIVKLLCAPQTKLCVVGDPDQTIYTWRGADVDIIMNFERDFEGCKTVILDENYRSKAHILEGANALIRNNRNRIKKDLFTRQHSDEKIVHFSAADDRNEPVWVAARIASLHHSGVPYREIAVLYRSNYLSRGLEKALLEAHVPYRIYGGIRFYERAEIKDALSYLRLLAPKHETDERELWKDLAVRRVINAPKRGIGARSLEQLEEQARSEDTNLYEVLKHPCIKGAKACRGIEEFVRVIEECREAAASLSIDMLMKKVLERSGYLQMLQDDNENERLENIKELLNDMEEYVENDPEATLDDYLQEIALYTDNENDAGGEVVQLMSVHASKGLEFDCVFIYSLCEGIFPSERSINEGGGAALEEERRLAYVAMTRARKQLFLSDSMGYSYVLDRIKMPSRFVKEIPRTLMEDVGAKPRSRFGDDVDVFSEGGSSSMSRPAPVSSASSAPVRKKRRGKLQKGDLVQHTSFGEGIVISVKDNLATIAFEQRYGVRKIMADHPSLSRK